MKMSTNKAALTVTAALLLAHLGVASAQLFTITHRPVYYPVYHNALDIVRNFEDLGEALHDFDLIFDTLSAPQRQVKVHEQVTVDDNRTSHLRLSVHENCHCKDSTPVELSNVSISVLDDQLTVEAETKHGTFMRSYTLPEHALPDNLTATYTSKMELHVACPTSEPPSHEPRHIHVNVDEAFAPPNAATAHDTKQGHTVHQQEKRNDIMPPPAATDSPRTQGQRNDASTTENVVGKVAGNTDELADLKHFPVKVILKDSKPNMEASFKTETKSFSPEGISSMILTKMKEIAEDYLVKEVKRAVITAPDTKQGHTVHQHEKHNDITSPPAASDIPRTQGQRADASTTENVVGKVAGNTDQLERPEQPTPNRLDVEKYIQTLEADLARLKSML